MEPAALFAALGTERLVLKPAVGGGSKDTFVLTPAEAPAATAQLQTLVEAGDFLAQPFLPQIQTQGEWSMVFFGGAFSHAVRKLPATGDFRVQHMYGGRVLPEAPPAAVLAQATDIVRRFAADCLYARVDGVEAGAEGGFWLMELELIEPLLYLEYADPAAYARYAAALTSRIRLSL